MTKILVPTSGQMADSQTADYAMQVAKAIDAEVLALHIVRRGVSPEAGELSLEYFHTAGREHEVSVECHSREGAVLDQIIEFAEQNEIDLIVMGASRGAIVDLWISSDVRDNTTIPVLMIPYQMVD